MTTPANYTRLETGDGLLPASVRDAHFAYLWENYPTQVAEGRTNIGWGVTSTGVASRIEGVGTVQTELVDGTIQHSVEAK